MKNKTISQVLIAVALFLILILFISEYPGPGKFRNLGLLLSAMLIAASIILAIFFREQQTPIRSFLQLFKERSSILGIFYPILVSLWPFIIYWQLVIPSSLSKTIQNDFIHWYFTYKNFLIANLSQFKIPLWSPAEATGYPFYSSPLTQTFYPLNLPYAFYGLLKGGISILSYQIFTIAGISIFALGLYFLLCEFKISRVSSFLVSILIPISFRLIETARFPNAVHAAAWYPWILFIIIRLSYANSTKKAVTGSLFLTLFAISLISAGYPYFAYYLIFLIPPFLILICLPSFRKQLLPDSHPIRWKLFIGSLAGSGIISLLIILPYLIDMQQLLSQTLNRTGKELVWSIGRWSTTLFDFIGSVIFPPAASSEGWIYFGIIGLVLIILFLLSSLIRSNTRERLFSRSLSIFFLFWIIFIIYLSCDGNKTPSNLLWVFLWNYLPGFSSMRIWARISIILLPIISILLGFAIQYFEVLLKSKTVIRKSAFELTLLGAITIGIMIFQISQINSDTQSIYWSWIDGSDPVVFLYLSIISTLILAGLFLYAGISSNPEAYNFIPAFLFLILFSLFDAQGGQISQWIWSVDARAQDLTHIYQPYSKQSQIDAFYEPRVSMGIPIPLNGEFNTSVNRISWHFQRYVDFLEKTDDQNGPRNQLLGLTDGTRIFFTSSIDYEQIEDFIIDSEQSSKEVNIEVVEFTGDSIRIQVDTPVSGNISYIDNWDPNWHVYIDSEEQNIQLLFGTFKSVHLDPGNHLVEFSYRPIIKGSQNYDE